VYEGMVLVDLYGYLWGGMTYATTFEFQLSKEIEQKFEIYEKKRTAMRVKRAQQMNDSDIMVLIL
jgi:hypothetical protein